MAGILRRERQECADGRHLARGGACAQPLPAPVGKEGAQVGRGDVDEAVLADFLTAVAAEEIEEAVRGGDIGAHGMRAAAAIVGEVTDGRAGQVVLRSRVGGERVVDLLSGEQLPRIC